MFMPVDKRGDDGDGDSTKCSSSPEQERIRKLYTHPVSILVYMLCAVALVSGIVLICAAHQPRCARGCTSESCVESTTGEDGHEIQHIYHCVCPEDTLEGFYCAKKVQRKEDQVFYTVGICLVVFCPFLLLNMRAWFAMLGYRNNLVLVGDDEDVEAFDECDEENVQQKPRTKSNEEATARTVSTNSSRSLPNKFPVNLRNNRAEFEPVVSHESTFASAEYVRRPNEGDMQMVDVVMESVEEV